MQRISKPETLHWLVSLTVSEKKQVRLWCNRNPPPISWDGTRADYAYLEMIMAPDGSFERDIGM